MVRPRLLLTADILLLDGNTVHQSRSRNEKRRVHVPVNGSEHTLNKKIRYWQLDFRPID